jgi:hypothetical protein
LLLQLLLAVPFAFSSIAQSTKRRLLLVLKRTERCGYFPRWQPPPKPVKLHTEHSGNLGSYGAVIEGAAGIASQTGESRITRGRHFAAGGAPG